MKYDIVKIRSWDYMGLLSTTLGPVFLTKYEEVPRRLTDGWDARTSNQYKT